MSLEIRPIAHNKKELKKFVRFGNDLYRRHPYYVPCIEADDVKTLLPDQNPAFEYCDAQAFMAYVDGKPAGKIVGIINNLVNQRSGKKEARFGFVDFVDDPKVADALFGAVEDWARSKGMTEIIGPMGFTDMDHEGMLVDGFNEMGTMATIYNYDYYPRHVERLGYKPDVDWVEYRIEIPDQLPEKHRRIAQIVAQKYGLRTVKCSSRKELKDKYGNALFKLINEAYDELYGYSPLSDRQIDYYIGEYLGAIRLDCVSVVVDSDDNLVAVGISIPSLSKALQKGRGRMLPFGWYHLLRAIYGKSNEVVDLLLIAVKKEYLSKGVNALIFADLVDVFRRNGFKWAESNLELEGNENVQRQWQYFNRRLHRRRRAYRKQL